MDTLPFGNSPAATNPPASTRDGVAAQERMNYRRSFDAVADLTTGCVNHRRHGRIVFYPSSANPAEKRGWFTAKTQVGASGDGLYSFLDKQIQPN